MGKFLYLVVLHQLVAIHRLLLVQWYKVDALGLESFISERSLDGIQVVCTH